MKKTNRLANLALATQGEALSRKELQLIKGGLADDGNTYCTTCQCVGSVGTWIANYPGGVIGSMAASIADTHDYCRSKRSHCTYNCGGFSGQWNISV